MNHRRIDLDAADLAVLAEILGTPVDALRAEIEQRPRRLDELLAGEHVADAVLDGDVDPLRISPQLLFAVLVHRSADELAGSGWIADWVGPGARLPVFDVEPLVEFADAPARLRFVSHLLVTFTAPPPGPVATERLGLDELVDWLDAVDPEARTGLLRQLGDLALFQAGVFPDSTGASPLSTQQAERFGRSLGMTDDEVVQLVDPESPTAGLDAMETLSASWYRAAADESTDIPVLVRDVANRIRAARRFLTHIADRYLHPDAGRLAFGG
jgi:hypothetical protein